jgi:hypothetical protein
MHVLFAALDDAGSFVERSRLRSRRSVDTQNDDRAAACCETAFRYTRRSTFLRACAESEKHATGN